MAPGNRHCSRRSRGQRGSGSAADIATSLDGGALSEVDYRETEHFRLTRDFLNAPERFFRHLLEEEPEADQ